MTIPSHTAPLALRSILAAVAIFALAGPAPVLAQSATGNALAFIHINGGVQALTGGFSGNVVFPESGGVYRMVLSGAAAQEQARFESDYRFDTGMLFDVSGGVRVWSYLSVGVGVSRFGIEETAGVSARVPHPIFFDRDRSISGASPPLARSEWAVHLQALATVPATQSFTVSVFGGPTFFNVQQQLVTDVSFAQAYPFDTATFSSAAIDRRSGSTVGFHLRRRRRLLLHGHRGRRLADPLQPRQAGAAVGRRRQARARDRRTACGVGPADAVLKGTHPARVAARAGGRTSAVSRPRHRGGTAVEPPVAVGDRDRAV